MWLSIILTLLLVLAVLFYYKFIIAPKRLINFYKKAYGSQFSIYEYPFAPLNSSQFTQAILDIRKKKDCFSFLKTTVSNFDMSITNIADKIELKFISPKLMQAYYEMDEQKYYQKYEILISGLKRMVGNGITFSTGELWKMKRRVITKMLNFKYIHSLIPKIESITKDRLAQFMAQSKQKGENQYIQFDCLDLTTKFASTVMLQLFFGGGNTKIEGLMIKGRTFDKHLRQLFLLLERQLLTPTMILGQKYAKLGVTQLDRDINQLLIDYHQFTRNFVVERLEELKKNYQGKQEYPDGYIDLIEAFYVEEILKKNEKITEEFTQSLVDDFATLFTAGSDTTSHALHMAIYYIFTNEKVRKELMEELNKNIPNPDELTYDSFKNCKFLDAVLNETMRIFSTVNGIFPREAKMDHELTVHITGKDVKFPVKKGTLVNAQSVTTHYKDTIYKDPMEFNPHRFLDEEGKLVNPEPFTFMNFSGGTRSCVGKQLAMNEMRVLVTAIVTGFDVQVNDQEKIMLHKAFAATMEGVVFKIRPLK